MGRVRSDADAAGCEMRRHQAIRAGLLASPDLARIRLHVSPLSSVQGPAPLDFHRLGGRQTASLDHTIHFHPVHVERSRGYCCCGGVAVVVAAWVAAPSTCHHACAPRGRWRGVEWLLFDVTTAFAAAGRGIVMGRVWSESGVLLATFTQVFVR